VFGVKLFKAGRKYYGADIKFFGGVFEDKVNSFCGADFDALAASGANFRVNCISIRESSGIEYICGFAFGQSSLEAVRYFGGTGFPCKVRA